MKYYCIYFQHFYHHSYDSHVVSNLGPVHKQRASPVHWARLSSQDVLCPAFTWEFLSLAGSIEMSV